MKKRTRRHGVERLETRRLLASAVIDVFTQTLKVTGDATSDTITVSTGATGVTVKVNSTTFTFDPNSFTNINVDAGNGNDVVTINAPYSASLKGGAGNDSLVGGTGSDTLDGGAGSDTMKGGASEDFADYSSRTANVVVGIGTLSDDGEAGEKDNVYQDVEGVFGGSGNDTIKGNALANNLQGNGGKDTLLGLDGNDFATGGPGSDSLDGGNGDDFLMGEGSADTLNGAGGTDTAANDGSDTLISIENASSATITNRTLTINGTAANDQLFLYFPGDFAGVQASINGAAPLFAFTSFDRIVVNTFGGEDLIQSQNDGDPFTQPMTVNAGDGNDFITLTFLDNPITVFGGAGDDQLSLSDARVRRFDGGAGVDFLKATGSGFTIDMNADMPGVENAEIESGTLIGNGLNNNLTILSAGTLMGGGGNDELVVGTSGGPELVQSLIDGGAGNDTIVGVAHTFSQYTLRGGSGNDSLQGGNYDDLLDGGAGADIIVGLGGNDTLDYSSRTAPLTIGPGTKADDGEAGENDNIATDIETILGGSGADNIKGTTAGNRLVGNGGNDTLQGLGGNDTLVGDTGADRLDGGDGSDTAQNEGGDTLISIENGGGGGGAPGTAVITAGRTLLITGTAGDDGLSLSADPELGEEVAVSTSYGTFLRSAFDSVQIYGLGGNDAFFFDDVSLTQPVTLDGGAGNDTFILTDTDATVIGGAGDDLFDRDSHGDYGNPTFDGGSGIDTLDDYNFDPIHRDLRTMPTVENAIIKLGELYGNELPNQLSVAATAYEMHGFGGNDTLSVGGEANYGPSFVTGGDGDDVISVNSEGSDGSGQNGIGGGAGNDTIGGSGEIDGGSGNDVISGSGSLFGGAGNDTVTGDGSLAGGDGNDSLEGSSLDDTLDGGAGADLMKGGGGNDTADYSNRSADLIIGIGTLADDGEAGEGDNVWLDIETVLGGDGNDNIRGRELNNLLVGGGGNDTLFGHYGNDTLLGGEGNDDLDGGPDSDTLNGEGGTDKGKQSAGDTLLSIEQPYA